MNETPRAPNTFTHEQIDRIQQIWRERWDGVITAQTQILNWLFAVQGGGLAGTLTFASKQSIFSCAICVALLSFVVGLALIAIEGAIFYRLELGHFRTFRRDALEFYASKIPWSEFQSREDARANYSYLCEGLAWVSGGFAALGLVGLAIAILHRA